MKKITLIILGLLVILMGVFTMVGVFTGPLLWYGIVQIIIGLVATIIGFTKD